jgi:pimeloyl-ACP methyl ester carboxylesterase
MPSGWAKGAGWAGAALLGGAAAAAVASLAAARRMQRVPETVPPDDLQIPADVGERYIQMPDGARIRALVRGETVGGRSPIVLLHGITLGAAVWPYQLRALADAGHRVVAVDLRGHGGSTDAGNVGIADQIGKDDIWAEKEATPGQVPQPSPLTLDRLAADVEELLVALDVTGAVLVGHSMGGMVALQMMKRDPALAAGEGRVAALALVSSAAHPADRRSVAALLAAGRPVISSGAGLIARLPGPTLPAVDAVYALARVTFGDQPSPRQVFFTGAMTGAVPVRVSAELLADIVPFDARDVLGSIRVPTTVVVGDHDVVTPPYESEALAAGIAGAELIILRGCGHMVMLERPAELDDVIMALAKRAA